MSLRELRKPGFSGGTRSGATRSGACGLASALVCAAALLGASTAQAQGGTIVSVTPVEGITVEYGTPAQEMLQRLPRVTTAELDNGRQVPIKLQWQVSEYVTTARGSNIVAQTYAPDVRGAYEVTATFGLPDEATGVRENVSLLLTARVTVGSAPLLDINDASVFNQPGRYVAETLNFGDVERTFQYYVPSSYQEGQSMPLMLTYHGAGSYGLGQMMYSGFHELAEREGFIVVAPDYGINVRGNFQSPGVTDFTSRILDHMIENYSVDTDRIYASGISMGGNASLTLAHELGDRIAAVAPVASGIAPALNRELPRPTTIVWFYGNQDSSYGPAVYEALDHLVAQNGANDRPEVTHWHPTDDDPTRITRFRYDGGHNNTEVVFYRIEEGGHTWPGRYQYASLITVGHTTRHIDATEVIWEHLSQHRLPR